jgi:hypothetical protein
MRSIMPRFYLPLLAALLMAPVSLAWAQPADVNWSLYTDPEHGFSAELPLGLFEPIPSEGTPGIRLAEVGGEAEISLYGGPATGMTRDALEARLASGEQIATITYRTGGESWFVLSGFYEPTGPGDQEIFYTKVLFSADHELFSAFEISFPAADKPRFEALVERLEDSFTRPSL